METKGEREKKTVKNALQAEVSKTFFKKTFNLM